MMRPIATILIFYFVVCNVHLLVAQVATPKSDSFFLTRKKGLLGKLGKSISINGDYIEPIKTVDPYKKFHKKIIRSITVVPVGFNYNMNDTVPLRKSLVARISDGLHRNTSNRVIRKNLFFKEGQPFYPLVVADNERFLREQPFLRDALITAIESPYSSDSVDVIVLTRDVFSIGGSFSLSSIDRARTEIREENLGGSGNRIALYGLYDKNRLPARGSGAELVMRNIKGTFINWSNGFKTFNPAFNSGRLEELNIFSAIEKPMVSRYTAITGAATFSFNSTINAYLTDSIYNRDFKYCYVYADMWGGYNIGYKGGKKKDSENRLRHFVAVRGFYNIFKDVPSKYITEYNFRYANINGVLAAYSLYRQNFYRTNFIYGFGRNEDVPEGLNATITAGYTNKQGVRRSYYGVEMDASKFNKKEGLFSYSIKLGGYVNNKKIEDADFLLGVNHFTKLFKLNPYWYNRSFMGITYTRQLKTFLNEPLFLRSDFGLPFFRGEEIAGQRRTTFKVETVFFNMKKIAGFRLAPFIFSDLSLIQPFDKPMDKSIGFPALGGGLRTRNESLVFGTVELRGYVFPRVPAGMQNWRVELTTKLLFKYNSSFIRRPDFVKPN
ncbi:MAG: hypothetical protein H7X88_00510 [Gloeobacteraceae cyanobacterium ES-bin-316]|nr:hypothetical protein [Ferruginibacter sp.]